MEPRRYDNSHYCTAPNGCQELKGHDAASKIVYCDKCGEYLGDLVDGVFYKFGRVVKESHTCDTPEGSKPKPLSAVNMKIPIRIVGKASQVFAKIKVLGEKAGKLTIGELMRLKMELRRR